MGGVGGFEPPTLWSHALEGSYLYSLVKF